MIEDWYNFYFEKENIKINLSIEDIYKYSYFIRNLKSERFYVMAFRLNQRRSKLQKQLDGTGD